MPPRSDFTPSEGGSQDQPAGAVPDAWRAQEDAWRAQEDAWRAQEDAWRAQEEVLGGVLRAGPEARPRPAFQAALEAAFTSGSGPFARLVPMDAISEAGSAPETGTVEVLLGGALHGPQARSAFAERLGREFASGALAGARPAGFATPRSLRPARSRAVRGRAVGGRAVGGRAVGGRAVGGRVLPLRSRPVAALLALAAAAMLWFGVFDGGLFGRSAQEVPLWRPLLARGVSYAGQPLVEPFRPRADRELVVGDEPLRLKLADGSARLLLSGNSSAELRKPCWLRGDCLESTLRMTSRGEAVVLADEREHKVEFTIVTAEAKVVLFGAQASVMPCDGGTCIVILSGRARVEPHGAASLELTAGSRLFVGSDGQIDFFPEFCKDEADPSVQQRLSNLRLSLGEVAEGVF